MMPARWYCPPGIDKPAHAVLPGVCQCLPESGPIGAPPGGRVYGGAIEADEDGWMSHPAGHWFCLRDAVPALLIRLETDPRIIRWVDVAGASADHVWRVPVLLEPIYASEDGQPEAFRSALDRIWMGNAWSTPERLQSLQRRLMMVCHGIGTNRDSLSSADAVQTAMDVLREGHEFDPHEVIAGGWVSEVLVLRTLIAACGMELHG